MSENQHTTVDNVGMLFGNNRYISSSFFFFFFLLLLLLLFFFFFFFLIPISLEMFELENEKGERERVSGETVEIVDEYAGN